MSRSARLREERRVERETKQAELAVLAKKKKRIRIIASITTSVVALLAVVALVIVGIHNYNAWSKGQPSALRATTMMETENVKIDGMMMAYYIYSSYQNNLQQYGEALGIDTTKSIKDQYFRADTSWFEFFRLEARAQLQQVLLFAEKAKEQGVTLSEEEQKEIDTYLQEADLSTYTAAIGLEKEDLRKVIELSDLASKMYEKTVEDMNLTEEDFEKYFKDNVDYFKTIDYKMLEIPYGENGWFDTAANAKTAAEVFKKVKTSAEFDTMLTQMVKALGGTADNAKQEVSDAIYNNQGYDKNDKFSVWAFEKGRKALEIYMLDTGSSYNVYLLTSLPKLAEADLRNVRRILLNTDSFETEAEAKETAEKVLAEWKKNGSTNDAFAKLAKEYSEDASTKEDGGLYENVSESAGGDIGEWLFKDGRKAGDAEILETDTGYEIVYYVGAGQELWRVNAETALIGENIDKLCAEYIKKWPITSHDLLMTHIPM